MTKLEFKQHYGFTDEEMTKIEIAIKDFKGTIIQLTEPNVKLKDMVYLK